MTRCCSPASDERRQAARTDVIVRVLRGPPFRVEVQDGAAATDAFRELVVAAPMAAPSSVSGRGLALVREVAARLGLSDADVRGKVVWFEL
jgi:hypothetical protein